MTDKCKLVVPGVASPSILSEKMAFERAKQKQGSKIYDGSRLIYTSTEADEKAYQASLTRTGGGKR